jgi:hypothetical protein
LLKNYKTPPNEIVTQAPNKTNQIKSGYKKQHLMKANTHHQSITKTKPK